MYLAQQLANFALTVYTGNENEATRDLIRNIFAPLDNDDVDDDPKWIRFDVGDDFSSIMRKHPFQGYMKWSVPNLTSLETAQTAQATGSADSRG